MPEGRVDAVVIFPVPAWANVPDSTLLPMAKEPVVVNIPLTSILPVAVFAPVPMVKFV